MKNNIEVFVDGSCIGNGTSHSKGGFGVVTVMDGKVIDRYQHFEEQTTNNIQEIKAILYALIKYGRYPELVTVYSDSSYCVNTFTNWMYSWARHGWVKSNKRRPENLELIQSYYNLVSQGYKINLVKIKGHAGHEFNEMADQLATGKIKLEN